MTTAATITAQLILDAKDYISGIDKASDATNKFWRDADGRLRDVNGRFVGAGAAAEEFSSKVTKVGQSMQKAGAAMTVGLTLPIMAFGSSAVQSAMEAESAMAEVQAVIESTGGAAGLTAEDIAKMASGFQKVTKFSDETIMSGESMLLTFTGIGKDVFPMATEAMLNMGEKFGSVDQAAMQLGKALNDPVAGVAALRRVGVMLTDTQEEQIKKFMEVGDVASAQKVILKELEVEFGGLARAAGDTTAGKFEQFKNKLDDTKEVIGAALIPHLIKLMDFLGRVVDWFDKLSPAAQQNVLIFVGIVAAAGPLITLLGTMLTTGAALGPMFAGMGTFIMTTLVPALGALFTFITATAIPAIVAFVAANAIWIVPLLLVAATVYLVYLAFKNNFMGITTTVQQAWFLITYAFNQGWLAITTAINGVIATFTSISVAFAAVIDAIRLGGEQFTLIFEDGSGALLELAVAFGIPKAKAQEFLAKVFELASGVKTNFDAIMAFGKNLVSSLTGAFTGIVNAIKNVIQATFDMIAAFAQLVVPDIFTPGSPTPFEMGLRGINSAMSALTKTGIGDLAKSVAPGVGVGMPTPVSHNNSTTQKETVVNIYNPAPERAGESTQKTLRRMSYLGA